MPVIDRPRHRRHASFRRGPVSLLRSSLGETPVRLGKGEHCHDPLPAFCILCPLAARRLEQFTEIATLPEVEGMVALLHALSSEITRTANLDIDYTRGIARVALQQRDLVYFPEGEEPVGIAAAEAIDISEAVTPDPALHGQHQH
eukprot:7350174-Heterocapsa_arctica.AAC.1